MKRLYDLSKEFGVELSDGQLAQFEKYYEMLIARNKVMNLTAITELEDVLVKHFADSLSLARVQSLLEVKGTVRLIDVGTGAGFPGIPLKIGFPEWEVLLLDSLRKRVDFLNDVINCLDLRDTCAVHSRAEDGARTVQYRQQFSICVSRAVANLSTLCEYCIPYLQKGGYFVSYKSGDVEEELQQAKNAIHILGGKTLHVETFTLPSQTEESYSRSLVVIKKERDTPKAYPRKAGTAAKNPIV